MSLFHLIEGVFVRLSVVPGLGFLHEYVHEMETHHTRRDQTVAKYRGYVQAIRGAGHDIAHGGHGEHDEHAEDSSRGHSRHGASSGQGQQVKEDNFDDDSSNNYYEEDDDFESYLQ